MAEVKMSRDLRALLDGMTARRFELLLCAAGRPEGVTTTELRTMVDDEGLSETSLAARVARDVDALEAGGLLRADLPPNARRGRSVTYWSTTDLVEVCAEMLALARAAGSGSAPSGS